MCIFKRATSPGRRAAGGHAVRDLTLGLLAEVLAAVPAFAAPPAAQATASILNPLTGALLFYTTQAPMQRWRMAFLHQGPELPAAGSVSAAVNVTWSNTWIDDSHAVVDDESWWVDPVVEYGITRRWAVSLATPAFYMSGGVMDSGIESFHHLFGLGDEGRNAAPRDRMEVAFWEHGQLHKFLTDSDRGLYTRAPVVSTRIGLAEGDLPATVKVSVTLPQFERKIPGLHTRAADFATSIATDYHWSGAWSSTASLAYVRSQEVDGVHLSLRDWLFSGAANLAYRATDATSVVFQLLQESAVGSDTHSGFDKASTEVLAGAQHRAAHRITWEFGVSENAFVNDNAADIAWFMTAVASY